MHGPRPSALRCSVTFLVPALLVVGVAGAQVPSRNVNMVSGTDWPGGDPFLQRQNEPSLAVSTRNPMHLLAGANDYRTVDLPGLPDDKMTGDAWLGVFMSSDGGATWKSTLVPGYPQEANSTSPLHGFDAGADPVVRAGPHGLFYYSGIVFDRDNPVLEARARTAGHTATAGVGTSTSAVFVARYIDNNVKENGNPIGYLGATLVASNDDPNVFLDKPWLAVDMPRLGAGMCTITQTLGGQTVTQTVPVGNVYVAYSQFTGKVSDGTTLGKLMFSRSTNCGATWSTPIAIGGTNHINQGATIALDPRTGVVYVVWRRFAWPLKPNTPTERDAILIARSLDRGKTFSAPEVVGEFQPFDQGTGGQQFRTNSYPTAGVDRFGRVLVAYSTRGVQQPDGDARIVLTWARYPSRLRALFKSDEDDGTENGKPGDARPSWRTPTPVDPDLTRRGHQVMPSMLVTGLRVQIAWVDLQEDHTWGVYAPLPTGRWEESREVSAERQNSPGHVFNDWISDGTVEYRRHSADIWIAQADPGDRLNFTVRRASTYKAGARWDKSDTVQQLQFNPPNLPLFRQGTAAFWSDYLDLGAQPLEQKARLRWRHSLQPPSAHVVFTDNRDVRAPTNGDWSDYTPPRSAALQADSIFSPGTPTPTCTTAHPENAGMRNQNIYTARVTQGLYVVAPGNAKPLGRIQRAFVVYAENNGYEAKTFRMSIASQPTGGLASFKQFAPLTQVDVTIGPRSSVSRTAYVSSTDPRAVVTVDVKEISGGVIVPPLMGGLQGTTTLNPDMMNPDMMNPDMMNPDMMNPDILSAEVYTPDMMNPDMMNPDMMNPDMMNPDMMNPDMMNPDMMNPDMMNPDMMNLTPSGDVNATILNPDMMNPDMMNADPTNASLTDTVWTITNNGNTTAAYDVKLLLRGSSQVPDGFKTQLLLYKTYLTPVARDCELTQETQNVLIASVPNPPFGQVGDTVTFDPADGSLGHTTLWLAPGESAKITLRVFDPVWNDDVVFDPVREVTPATAPQPVDTASAAAGKRTPDVVTTSPIVFLARPTATPIGGYITPPVQVLVQDENGTPIVGATVTLSLATNPGGATLYGGTATTGSDGIATFDQLWLDRLGSGYRLVAAGTHISNDSGPFDVVPLVVTTAADSGPGSLRAAIENANRNAGHPDAISFDIGGGGTHTIALASAFPAIVDALTIDATTQPGYAGMPLVRLDGVGAGPGASGLIVQSTGATIRSLAITRFSSAGVRLDGATGALVEDSYIGTDGVADLGNGGDGLVIAAGSGNQVRRCTVSGNGGAGVVLSGTSDDDLIANKIGTNAAGAAAIPNDSSGILLRVSSRQRIGTGAPGSGNLISGNALYGIELSGPGIVSDVLIAGNRIGTNAAGTAAIPNGLGVYVFGTSKTGITIGGSTPDARNLISGNSSDGIHLNTTHQVAVVGNYIGTDASGAAGLGNVSSGVYLYSGQDNRVGGTTAAEANTIAFNGGAGIELAGSGSGNAFLGNRLISNGGLGIDLAPPGPNANDVGDGDAGPNDLLNYPVLASAVDNGTQTTVSGSVDIGAPGATVTIQFFHNVACDLSGYGEGQTLVGQTTIATGGDGTATFVANLPGGLNPGYITATTVLPPTNTTSEFSACRQVVQPAPLFITTYSLPNGSAVLPFYNALLGATGGLPPYSWRLAVGSSLPGTLVLDPATGAVSGTLTSAVPADYTFTVEARDSDNPPRIATRSVKLTVYAYAVQGTLLWNEAPITDVTHQPTTVWATLPQQWFPSYQYDTVNGTFAIPVPAGVYGLTVDVVDAAPPFDGNHFPGDYYCYVYSIPEVNAGNPLVTADLACSELIHLTQPVDNGQEVTYGSSYPDYPSYSSPVHSAWVPIPAATTYEVRTWDCDGQTYACSLLPPVVGSDPEATVSLPSNVPGRFYESEVLAYNVHGVLIGIVMVEYAWGFGWDYRYIVP